MSGTPFETSGVLKREGGGFVLHGDDGRRFPLQLQRTPVDHFEKRVRLGGRLLSDGTFEVNAIGAG